MRNGIFSAEMSDIIAYMYVYTHIHTHTYKHIYIYMFVLDLLQCFVLDISSVS